MNYLILVGKQTKKLARITIRKNRTVENSREDGKMRMTDVADTEQ
jgi:hypothetical protein